MGARIAIAVVSWNTRALLDACLQSLRAAHEAGIAEVHVVDNASTDGSAAMVAADHPWVTLHEPGRNLGYGPAVNLVAAQTTTPFIAAANSDLRVAPDALAALLDAATAHPDAGVLAPRLLTPGGETQHSVHPFPTVRLGLLLSTGLALRRRIARSLPMEGHWDPAVAREVDWAHGALLLIRRRTWDAVGGFDPGQFFYAEDLDLCWRARRAGYATRYVPEACVQHEVSAAAGARWDSHARAVRSQRSTYAWLLARRGPLAARSVALANLAGPATRAPLYALGARVRAGLGSRRDAQRLYLEMHRTGLEPAERLRAHARGDDDS